MENPLSLTVDNYFQGKEVVTTAVTEVTVVEKVSQTGGIVITSSPRRGVTGCGTGLFSYS